MSIAEKLTTIAENEQKVYDAGRDSFLVEYISSVQQVEKGYYKYAFAGKGWTSKTFKPKCSIHVGGAALGMFQESKIEIDFKKYCEDNNIEITFGVVNASYCFHGSCFTKLPHLDWSNVKSMDNAFSNQTLCTEISMSLNEDGNQTFSGTFYGLPKLSDFTVTSGKIGKNINFSGSPLLTHESLMSIINALKDFSDTGESRTITLGSKNINKLTVEEQQIAIDKGWTLA